MARSQYDAIVEAENLAGDKFKLFYKLTAQTVWDACVEGAFVGGPVGAGGQWCLAVKGIEPKAGSLGLFTGCISSAFERAIDGPSS